MKRIAMLVALAVGGNLANPRAATAAAGAEAFDFLQFDAGARAVALGGAYTALASDSNALLYNPGGLGFLATNEATFMHNQYVQGLNQEYVGFASSIGLGAQLNYVNLGGIPRTTISQPDGTGSNFSVSDRSLGVGYG